MVQKERNKEKSSSFSKTAEDKEFGSKLVDLARVVRVVAGGRRFSFRAVVVVGNRLGKVGVGVAKGPDVTLAVEKATRMAKNNLIDIPITKDGTIPHQVEAKYSASRILLKPLLGNRGIVAGGAVRAICDLAGIRNITSKVLSRSGNKLNNAGATIAALKKLKTQSSKLKTTTQNVKVE